MQRASVQNIGLSVCNSVEHFSSIVSQAETVAKAAILLYHNHNHKGVGLKREDAENKTNILCYLIKQEINLWKVCAHVTKNESAQEQIVEVKHLLDKWQYIYKNLKNLNLDYRNNKPFKNGEEETYWANIMEHLDNPRIYALSHKVTLARGGAKAKAKKSKP